MSKYGKKPVYLKAETECLDETDTPVRLPDIHNSPSKI